MTELEKKTKRAKELADTLVLRTGIRLTKAQSARVEDEEEKLKFQLKRLSEESEKKQKELAYEINLKGEELKIQSMEKVLEIIKGNV